MVVYKNKAKEDRNLHSFRFISLHFKCDHFLGRSRGRFDTEARCEHLPTPKVLGAIPRVRRPPRVPALADEVTLGKTLNNKLLERTFPTGD